MPAYHPSLPTPVYSASDLCKAMLAGAGTDEPLPAASLDRVLRHDPGRGMLEVQAGVRWSALASVLGAEFSDGSVGASVARNSAGPDGRPTRHPGLPSRELPRHRARGAVGARSSRPQGRSDFRVRLRRRELDPRSPRGRGRRLRRGHEPEQRAHDRFRVGHRRGRREGRCEARQVRRPQGSPTMPEGRHVRGRSAVVPDVRVQDGARIHPIPGWRPDGRTASSARGDPAKVRARAQARTEDYPQGHSQSALLFATVVLLEAPEPLGVRRELGSQHFDRDFSPELEVSGAVDVSLPPWPSEETIS